MKTDTLFYQLFQNFPSCFFELIGQPTSEADAYQFTSVKIKQKVTHRIAESARQLIDKARHELADEATRGKVIELIETIVLYKLPHLSRQEIEAMFELSELKQTRYFHEVKQEGLEEGRLEGKLEAVPQLLLFGLSVEQVAEALGLSVDQVRQASPRQTSD